MVSAVFHSPLEQARADKAAGLTPHTGAAPRKAGAASSPGSPRRPEYTMPGAGIVATTSACSRRSSTGTRQLVSAGGSSGSSSSMREFEPHSQMPLVCR